MRVPLNFDYHIGEVWYGYQISFCHEDYPKGCERCQMFASIMGIPPQVYKGFNIDNPCPEWRDYFKVDPPKGPGFQLWETTTEGSPISPVFDTAEKLAEWCTDNATIFADQRMCKADWLQMIKNSMEEKVK